MRTVTRGYLVALWAVVGVLAIAALILSARLFGEAGPPRLWIVLSRTLVILWAMTWVALPFCLRGFAVQYRREMGAYFLGPIPYVCLTVLLLLLGLLVFVPAYLSTEGEQFASLTPIQVWSALLFVFTIPILTMRLLAAERSSGTFEVLMTDPITDFEVVLAKFCAAMTVLAAILLPQAAHVAIVASFSRLSMAEVLCGYLGVVCVGALMTSIGLFLSSLVKSQAVAAVVGVIVLFLLFFGAFPLQFITNLGDETREFWEMYVSMPRHMESFFGQGILSTRLLCLYVSTTALFLFFSIRAVESRKWR